MEEKFERASKIATNTSVFVILFVLSGAALKSNPDLSPLSFAHPEKAYWVALMVLIALWWRLRTTSEEIIDLLKKKRLLHLIDNALLPKGAIRKLCGEILIRLDNAVDDMLLTRDRFDELKPSIARAFIRLRDGEDRDYMMYQLIEGSDLRVKVNVRSNVLVGSMTFRKDDENIGEVTFIIDQDIVYPRGTGKTPNLDTDPFKWVELPRAPLRFYFSSEEFRSLFFPRVMLALALVAAFLRVFS